MTFAVGKFHVVIEVLDHVIFLIARLRKYALNSTFELFHSSKRCLAVVRPSPDLCLYFLLLHIQNTNAVIKFYFVAIAHFSRSAMQI